MGRVHAAGQLMDECASTSGGIENPFVRLHIRQIDGAPERFTLERY